MCPCCVKQLYFEITKGLFNRKEKLIAVRSYVDSLGIRLFRFKNKDISDVCYDSRLTKKEKGELLKELLDCVDNNL